MANLFIVGNGFDRAHNLPTTYEDFHKFIKNNCKEMQYIGSVEQICTEQISVIEGMLVYDAIEYLDFLQIVINQTEGTYWKDFENTLGQLDFSDVLLDYGYSYKTDVAKDMNSRCIDSIQQAILMVKEYFPLWVNSIAIDSCVKKNKNIQNLLMDDHYIINFNYTNTIEKVYGIDDVFHIHGTQYSEIIFGHGDFVRKDYDYDFEIYPGADFKLNMIKAELKKPVDKIIKNERTQNFLKSLQNVEKVYSYGFSYGSVDLPYIYEICKHIDTADVIWLFNDFSSDYEIKKYENALRSCGYKGKIDKFHV